MNRRAAIQGLLSVVAALPAAIVQPSARAETFKDKTGKTHANLSFAETVSYPYPVTIRLENGWMHVHMEKECKGLRFSIGDIGTDVPAQEILNALLCPERPSPRPGGGGE